MLNLKLLLRIFWIIIINIMITKETEYLKVMFSL